MRPCSGVAEPGRKLILFCQSTVNPAEIQSPLRWLWMSWVEAFPSYHPFDWGIQSSQCVLTEQSAFHRQFLHLVNGTLFFAGKVSLIAHESNHRFDLLRIGNPWVAWLLDFFRLMLFVLSMIGEKQGVNRNCFWKIRKIICRGFFSHWGCKRRVWGGNPHKYLTGWKMSEKRNLVHWSILTLRDCKLPPLPSAAFSGNRNQKNVFFFAYYSSIGSRFWQVAFLLLLIILQRTFLNVFAKMTPSTAFSTRNLRKPFPFSVIQETEKWHPDRRKNFLFTLNTTALFVLPKMGAHKLQIFQTHCLCAAVVNVRIFEKITIYSWIMAWLRIKSMVCWLCR